MIILNLTYHTVLVISIFMGHIMCKYSTIVEMAFSIDWGLVITSNF
jgi:hypothetical protein